MSKPQLLVLGRGLVSLIVLAFPFASIAQSTDTVIVVPFRNLTQQSSNDWIGAGIAATVASDLQQLGMSMVWDQVDGNLPDEVLLTATRAAGARWLVTGGYQQVGESLRITMQLIDVETGAVSQGGTFDGVLEDLFRIQDEIVAALGDKLISPPPTGRTGLAADVTGAVELEDVVPETVPGVGVGGGGFVPALARGRARALIGRTTEPPEIDGRLDDAVWETATHITEFVQVAPVEGAPGSEQTEVWMAYDDDNMYFAFYAHYENPGMMRVNRADRDEMRGDDVMSLLFDPFLDQQRAYQFEVNGYGVQADSLVNADGSSGMSGGSMMSSGSRGGGVGQRRQSSMSRSGAFGIRGDSSWDALFDSAGQVVEDGWVAEVAIPFKSLRYPARELGEPHLWGFQITRRIRGKSEAQSWSPVSRAVAGQLTQFGELEGLENLSQSRNLEILPELTGVGFGSMDRDTGNFNQNDPIGDFGLGVKYGITPNLTADVTYNPDFSQIESDRPQIETNQRFALFYPEQRPFFLEGQEIFQVSTPLNLLNTRTIVDPRFGGKLTGKVGNTTLGLIVADDEAAGRLDDQTDSRFGSTAQTVVGRVRYDFYSESYLGAIMTAREFGQEYNRVAGVDGRFRLGEKHRFSFLAVESKTYNETEGALGGRSFEADFTRQGRNFGYAASYGSIDPEFRTESGFLPRVDLRQASGELSYTWWPESTLMSWGPALTYFRLYDHAGVLQDEQIQARTTLQFQGNVFINGTVSRDLERYREIDFRKTAYGMFGGISGRRLSIFGGVNAGDGILFDDNPYLGRTRSLNVTMLANPTTRLSAQLRVLSSRFTNPIGNTQVFDVKIFRSLMTYQFTDRFLLRHIMEHNTLSVTLGNNVLLTYRINAGTVAHLGYDDRYQGGTRINDSLFSTIALQRTNRAVFAKVSYLFRY